MSALKHNSPKPPKGRVLVTGADGFTGRYLIPELQAAGFETLGGVRHGSPKPGELTFDLMAPLQMKDLLSEQKPSAIIHLAAISFPAHGNLQEIYSTNVLGTLNLLSAINDTGGELDHLIIASSAAVYGEQTVAELHENLIPNPRSDYGISKLACEHLALTKSRAQNLAITRPFNYTGVGQPESFLIPKLVAHFVQRKPFIELGNIDVAREFNDVRWAVKTYAALLSANHAQEVLNLCSGQAYTLKQVLSSLEKITGHSPEIRVNPAFVRENDPPLISGAIEKASALGMPAPPADPEAALQWLLEWMCEHYKSNE